MKISKLFGVSLVVALAIPAPFVCGIDGAFAGSKTSIGQTMALKDEGMFFVNGQLVLSNFPSAGSGMTSPPLRPSMSIDVRPLPTSRELKKHKVPIIMVHGGGLTGDDLGNDPRRTEGWSTYFTRQGFDTYIVDFPGRGRAGFNVTPLNQAKFEDNVSLQPSIGRTGSRQLGPHSVLGRPILTPFPGVQSPQVNPDGSVNQAAVEQFSAQGVPSAEVTLTPAAAATIPAAIVELLKKVGPAILRSTP